MDIRHVVTCFLRHQQQRTILLGQRSEDVNTYPLHYAAISGSIEDETPLERARIEIAEETSLRDNQIQLTGEGQAIRFPAWDLDTLWVVHPFLFECKDPASVDSDWEHTRLEWVAPERITDFKTVPQLYEAWDSARRAAAAGGRPDAERIFQRVREDQSHGAGELGIWTLEGIRAGVNEISVNGASEAVQNLCQQATTLRPSMATPFTAGLDAWQRMHDLTWSGEKAGEAAQKDLDRLIEEREQAPVRIAEYANDLIPDDSHVVTLTISFSVLVALHAAQPAIRLLTVGESRPACEGAQTARETASSGIETELLTDAAAARRTRDADLLILGADSITADGSIVNKTGSLALSSVAQRADVTVMIVAPTHKILPENHKPGMEKMDPDELGYSLEDVTVRNPYFERVPSDLVDIIVTESGFIDHGEIRRRSRIRAQLSSELDSDA